MKSIQFDYRRELDTGISYAGSTNAIQNLLDKMRANSPKTVQQKLLEPGAQATPQGVFDYQRLMKRNTGVPPAYDGPGSIGPPSITGLSSKLDLIEFAGAKALLGIGGIGIGAGAAGIGAYHIIHTARRQREWRENATDRDRLKLARDIYIDRHGGMYPENHPGMKGKRITELIAKLNELIELEYPKEVKESVWRRLKKPSKEFLEKLKTGNDLIRKYKIGPSVQHMVDKLKKPRPRLSAIQQDLIELADPRPRNNLGEFRPQAEGAPDPNAMYQTYRQPKQRGISGDIAAATLASPLVGGGAMGGGLAVKELVKRLKKGARR
jgi:hypothetical protein